MWLFCASERPPCVAVAPPWSPMRSSRIAALASCNVLWEYIRHRPGMPCFRQNAWELGRLLIFGRARCGRSVGRLCLVVCCLRCRVLGCVFQYWMSASMSRLLMVNVGIVSG